jgi:TIR domain
VSSRRPEAAPGTRILVQVFFHTLVQAGKVATVAANFDEASTRRTFGTLIHPLPQGTRIDVIIEAPGLDISEPHQWVIWRGDAEPVNFLVNIPAGAGTMDFFLIVRVSVSGVPYGRLMFKLSCSKNTVGHVESAAAGFINPHRRAFCSYSSQDAIVVTRCAQLLTALGYDCFHDKSSLKPGEAFEKALLSEIRNRELFLLFWSSAARQSDWVRKETTWAYETQCSSAAKLPDIVPIVLDGPPPPEPFEFLQGRHFDDRFQYMVAALRMQPN